MPLWSRLAVVAAVHLLLVLDFLKRNRVDVHDDWEITEPSYLVWARWRS
ncbi:hypothetical protein ACQP1U_11640 [Actinomycetota bacterium]